MARRSLARVLLLLGILALVASCGSGRIKDGPPRSGGSISRLPDDAVPRPEPRSRFGNAPVYEVFGKRYAVMTSSQGYKERGVASWYGKKFHGNATASRERYDMYAMTAAHKTLPIPTYVRVRNLQNGKTVVVRVNDRGPFADNRIIDLSYSAALKLDMIRNGTSLVEVEAINFDDPPDDRPTRQAAAAAPTPRPAVPTTKNSIFVQVGAFGSRENAERRLALLRSGGIGTGFVLEDATTSPVLYRVRVGPITGVEQYDLLVTELEKLGVDDPYLISN